MPHRAVETKCTAPVSLPLIIYLDLAITHSCSRPSPWWVMSSVTVIHIYYRATTMFTCPFLPLFSAYNSFPSYLVITCVYQFKRTTINHQLEYYPYPSPCTFTLCGGVGRGHVLMLVGGGKSFFLYVSPFSYSLHGPSHIHLSYFSLSTPVLSSLRIHRSQRPW